MSKYEMTSNLKVGLKIAMKSFEIFFYYLLIFKTKHRYKKNAEFLDLLAL